MSARYDSSGDRKPRLYWFGSDAVACPEPLLAQKGYQVRGLDCGFFRDCLLSPAVEPPEQIVKDIRDLEREDLDGITRL